MPPARIGKSVLLALGALILAPSAEARVRLIGIQLYLPIAVYRDLPTFQRYIESSTDDAIRRAALRPGETPVIVFPEHIGTFLAFTDQGPAFYAAPTLARAVLFCFFSNPSLYFRHIALSFSVGRWDIFETFLGFGNFLRFRAGWTWRAYLDSFSALARRHRAVVVAGSISIPRPEDFDKSFPPVYGTSAVFGPDGGLLGVVRKQHPVSEETLFMTPAPPSELHPIATPAGNVGVLICSDSWFSDAYDLLRDSDMLAVPGIGEDGLQAFDRALRAYRRDGLGGPAAVAEGTRSYWDSFFRKGLVSKMHLTRARAAIMPFLTGPIIDLESGGPGLTLRRRGQGTDVRVVLTQTRRSSFLDVTVPPREKSGRGPRL